jgi:hypothetical protein
VGFLNHGSDIEEQLVPILLNTGEREQSLSDQLLRLRPMAWLELRYVSLQKEIREVFRLHSLDCSVNSIPEGVIALIFVADVDVYRPTIIILSSCEVVRV